MATSMYRHPRGGGGGNRSFNRSSPAAQGFRRNNNNRSYNVFPPGKFNFSDIRGRGMPDYHIRPRNMGNKVIPPSEDAIVKETANENGVNQRHAPIIGENKAVSPSKVVTVKEIANEIGHAPIAGENKAVSPSGVSKEPIAGENGIVAAHLQNGNSTEFSKSNGYTQPPPVTKLINGTMENGIPSVKSDTTITPVKGILVHLNKEDSATQVIGNNGDNVGSKKKSVRFVETEEDMAEEVKFLADAFREFSNALGILAGKLVTRYGNK